VRGSPRFTQWLDEHRSFVSAQLRHVLLEQLATERSKGRYRALEAVARAILALDPLNEEATLAAAESLAMSGSKTEAIALLDHYMGEIGAKSGHLRVSPRILRERISEYLVESDVNRDLPLIGREEELAALNALIAQAATGASRACVITGPSGIGKSRLLREACSLTALAGRPVLRVRLHQHDARRPFSILREFGPALLDLPGAIGASPEAIDTLRGLCGRGPALRFPTPTGELESQAVVAEVTRRVNEVVDAVSGEQPFVLAVEDAHWIDQASLELILEILGNNRAVCVLMASQRHLDLPSEVAASPIVHHLPLAALDQESSAAILEALYAQINRTPPAAFVESALGLCGGVPFHLHALFRHYHETGNLASLPRDLSHTLSARLSHLPEPARSVFDTIVILGANSTEVRLEQITQLPRHDLVRALRVLDESGLIRSAGETVVCSHELFSLTATQRMPAAIARLLHRAAAQNLSQAAPKVDSLEIAGHWEACNEYAMALDTLIRSANEYLQLGRPHEAIAVLTHAQGFTDESHRLAIQLAFFDAYRAAGEFSQAVSVAAAVGIYDGQGTIEMKVRAVEAKWRAGESYSGYRGWLETAVCNPESSISLRCSAAKILVVLSEDLNDVSIGRRALDAISDIAHDYYEALTPSLIFETVFGSKDRVLALGNTICALLDKVESVPAKVEVLASAGIALWRSGNTAEGLNACERAYALAKDARLSSACTMYSSILADMHWHAGDINEATKWFDAAAGHLSRSPSADRGLQHLGLGVMLALDHGDPSRASDLLEQAERRYPTVLEDRMGLERLAYRALIEIASGRELPDFTVAELVQGHKARRGTGLQDVVAHAAIGALKTLGRYDEAETLRVEYFRDRRDGFSVSPMLTHLFPSAL
jgi:tetratricopeptide (TPR) repeat protein